MSAPSGHLMAPGFRRNMLVLTTLMISLMAAVDMTIVAVALPYMAGNLNAGYDQITWVVTMFTCGQALIIGVTGYLSRLLGRRRLAVVVVIGFMASSIACGLAQNLTQIVVFRFIQGLFSGPLIPLSQSMLVDAFAPEDRPRALSIWSMGVLGGPAIGPVIGGYLAQNLDWRWNFWVNIPIGVLALFLIMTFVRRVEPLRVKTDFIGLTLLGIWVISLQIMLDQGDKLDWFDSHEIWILAILAMTFFLAFVWRGSLLGPRNIMNLGLFRDRNFLVCSLLIALLGSIFLGMLIVTPQLLIGYYGWEVDTAGLTIGAGGAIGVFGSLLGGRLTTVLGIRLILVAGSTSLAIGWYLYSRLNPFAGPIDVFVPEALIFFGLMFIFPGLSSRAFANLTAEQRDEGAGMFNFLKTLGFSFGVTFVGLTIYRGNQANWTRYVGDLSPGKPGFAALDPGQWPLADLPALGAVLGAELSRQVGILTIVQLAEMMAVLAIMAMPLALLLKGRVKS